MRFFCIADENTVRGFRLAGVDGQVAVTAQEAAAALQKARTDLDYGILILTNNLAQAIRTQVEAMRLECDRPLVVEIPGFGEPRPSGKRLQRIVQEAVGIRVGPEEA